MRQRRQTRDELLRFRLAMDGCGDAIYLVDRATMRFVDVNQTACARMGYSRDELLQMGPQDLLAEGREEIERLYDAVIATGAAGMTTESSARAKDGRDSTTELHRRALRVDGRWTIVSIARDVTRRKQVEQALHDSEQRHRMTFEYAGSGIAHVDLNGRFVSVNRSLCALLGYAEDELVGRIVKDLSHPEDRDKTDTGRAQVLSGQLDSMKVEKRYLRRDGETIWVVLTIALARNDDGKPLYEIVVFDDITLRKQVEERNRNMAHHDSLTGLPNRLLFDDRLAQAIRFARRDSREFALLYLDLDKFKPVNDALGHGAGDELLQAVAARIRQQVRESDTVARVGGDEFTVILPGIGGRQQAETVARKIAAAIGAPFHLGSDRHRADIGTSIGIAIFPADAADAAALVKAADAAMYRCKQPRQ